MTAELPETVGAITFRKGESQAARRHAAALKIILNFANIAASDTRVLILIKYYVNSYQFY